MRDIRSSSFFFAQKKEFREKVGLIMTKITQIDNKSAATAWSPFKSCADVIALGTKVSLFFFFKVRHAIWALSDLIYLFLLS